MVSFEALKQIGDTSSVTDRLSYNQVHPRHGAPLLKEFLDSLDVGNYMIAVNGEDMGFFVKDPE